MRRLRSFRGRRLLLPLLLTVVATCGGDAPTSAGPPPPPLPEVDLSAAEPAVREQLVAARDELETVLAGDAPAAERAAAWGRLGRLYHAYELDEPASIAYRHARFLAPRDPRWAYLLGVVRQRQGAFDDALASFDAVLELAGEGRNAARFRRAEVLLAKGDREAARAEWRELAGVPAFAAAASAALGRLALAEGRPEVAVGHLERALERQPQASALYHAMIQALRAAGRSAESQRALERAGTRAVDWPDPDLDEVAALRTGVTARVRAASRAAAAGDLQGAVAIYEQALATDPHNLEALQGLAGVLAARGEGRRAIELLTRVLALEPGESGVRLRLARLLELGGEPAAALDHYRVAVERAPALIEAHLRLAGALQRAGRPGEAVEVYDRLLVEHSDVRLAILGRIQALAAAGETGEARRAVARHLQARPDDLEARLLAGQLAAQAGEGAEAVEAFGAVLDAAEASAPLRAAAAFNLGLLRARAGDPGEARRRFERAVELAPDMVPARVALVQLLLRSDDAPGAAGHAAAAVAAQPGDLDLHLLAAQAFAAAGRRDEARRRIEAALARFPDDPRLLAARRQLAPAAG